MPFLSSFPFPHPYHNWARNLSLYGLLAKKSKVPLFMITNVNIVKHSENVGRHPQAHDSAFYILWNQCNTTLPVRQGKKTIWCPYCCLSSRISWRLRSDLPSYASEPRCWEENAGGSRGCRVSLFSGDWADFLYQPQWLIIKLHSQTNL